MSANTLNGTRVSMVPNAYDTNTADADPTAIMDGIRSGRWAAPVEEIRRAYADALAAGTNPKIVSEVLGHKEIAITLDRYSHALPTMQATAMARLDAILGRGDDAAPAAESDKGSNKGSPTPAEASERPDPSVDRARNGEIGTAYRIRTGDLRLERAVS